MFEGILPDNWEIYATTAANSSESSWATYCSPDDKVNGKSIGSCLGDEYSVNWMEDTEGAEETKGLQKQFQDVQTKTKGSHVQQFGVLSWTDEALKDYQGDVAEFSLLDRIYNKAEKCVDKLYYYFHKDKKAEKEAYLKYLQKAKESRVDSRDTKLHYLKNLHHTYRTDQTQQALGAELNYRKNVEDFFSHYAAYTGVTDVEVKGAVKNFECLKASIKELKTSCPSLWGEYTLKYVKYFNAACEKPDFSTKDLVSIISGCKNI